MTVKNAKTLPKVYYGLHMAPGVAEYREPGQQPLRIFIDEQTIKNMDPTFQGRPIYVRHVEEVKIENLGKAHPESAEGELEEVGYVVESFFNKADGKHWAKFIVVNDRGHDAIRQGWKLSNAYIPKSYSGGGLWHGVEYAKEVTSGEYEHLAIVPNPRYEESIILTPDEFKKYNGDKELELTKLANSQDKQGEDKSMKLSFWKKSKMENAAELESTVVTLPKSGKEKSIVQLVNDMDDIEMNAKDQMCNGDHHVMVGEEKMKVNDLVKKHMEMCNELADLKKPKEDEKKENDEVDDEVAKKKALELAEHEEKEIVEKKAQDEKKENDEGEKKEEKAPVKNEAEKAEGKKHFDALKNAPSQAMAKPVTIDLSVDQVARGKTRYGSAS